MNKKTKTIAFRIACLLVGALINYGYLVFIGRVSFNNAISLVFFSGVFTVLVTELVATFKILDIDRFDIHASADERIIPENKVESPQTIWLALLFSVAIVFFQRSV